MFKGWLSELRAQIMQIWYLMGLATGFRIPMHYFPVIENDKNSVLQLMSHINNNFKLMLL